MTGTVKWFNNKKGYGFIVIELSKIPTDVMVHYNNIVGEGYKTLTEGETVLLDVKETAKGLKAERVCSVNVS